jgi:hypothetical protein
MVLINVLATIMLFILIYWIGVAATKRLPKIDSVGYQLTFWGVSFLTCSALILAIKLDFRASTLIGIATAHLASLLLFGKQQPLQSH